MKLEYLVIHCTATPEGMEVTSDMLKQWHLGPAKTEKGTLKYMGSVYPTADRLPDEEIGGVHIRKLIGGRGWKQVGYSDLIHLNGQIENIVPYNEDDNVDPWEITNGILASSNKFLTSRHVVYAGGMTRDNKFPKDTRTEKQKEALELYVVSHVNSHSHIKVIGHNQIDPRACPSFDVRKWAKDIISPDNIAQDEPKIKITWV